MKAEAKITTGTKVQWKWMGRFICGVVKEVYFESAAKEIKGKIIKRNGTAANPACLVQSEAGNFALKLQSELQISEKEKTKSIKPRMFSK